MKDVDVGYQSKKYSDISNASIICVFKLSKMTVTAKRGEIEDMNHRK